MKWTNKPPKKKGSYYWRQDKKSYWICLNLMDVGQKYLVIIGDADVIKDGQVCFWTAKDQGGEWWDAPVPSPDELEKWSVGLGKIIKSVEELPATKRET